MSKIHYFSNKFSKIFKRWGFQPPQPRALAEKWGNGKKTEK